MWQPDDLIGEVRYAFFDSENSKVVNFEPKKDEKLWYKIDLLHLGRCYSTVPTKEMLKLGIKSVDIILHKAARVFFHTPGVLMTNWQPIYIDVINGRSLEIDMEHEVFNMLDFGGKECDEKDDYNKDFCTLQILHEVLKNTQNS